MFIFELRDTVRKTFQHRATFRSPEKIHRAFLADRMAAPALKSRLRIAAMRSFGKALWKAQHARSSTLSSFMVFTFAKCHQASSFLFHTLLLCGRELSGKVQNEHLPKSMASPGTGLWLPVPDCQQESTIGAPRQPSLRDLLRLPGWCPVHCQDSVWTIHLPNC